MLEYKQEANSDEYYDTENLLLSTMSPRRSLKMLVDARSTSTHFTLPTAGVDSKLINYGGWDGWGN
jgi:hypothetical protein